MPDLYTIAGRRREYRDHQLEWMVRSGGIEIILAGIRDNTIRFSWPAQELRRPRTEMDERCRHLVRLAPRPSDTVGQQRAFMMVVQRCPIAGDDARNAAAMEPRMKIRRVEAADRSSGSASRTQLPPAGHIIQYP